MLGVLEDLFFGVKITDAAKQAGCRTVYARTAEAFWSQMQQGPVLVVIDLTCQAMQPLSLLAQLREHPEFCKVPTLGFLPHVLEDLKRQALEAGCQRVVPRSVFSSRAGALIAEAVASRCA